MFRHYLTTTLAHLLKNRQFVLINMAGLAVGLAACVLLALYVQQELSWDRQWSNGDRLFRVNTTVDATGGEPRHSGGTPMPLQAALGEYFAAEIEYAARVRATSREVFTGDVRYQDPVVDVDADIAGMLDFDVLSGDLAATLANPGNIALSAASAERYFGTVDAVGRTLEIVRSVSQAQSVREVFQVSAVYRIDGNTVIDLPAMTMLLEQTYDAPTFANWVTLDFSTYVQLRPAVNLRDFSLRFADFINRYVTLPQLNMAPSEKPADRYALDLQNISDIYLDSTVNDTVAGGSKVVLIAFSGIAALVLLIACLNFTILSTARVARRAREVTLRKSVGASSGQLLMQFLGESFLVVAPAMVLATVLAELLLPLFSAMVNRELALHYAQASTWVWVLGLTVSVSICGGLYPALVLAWFRPARTAGNSGAQRGRKVIGLQAALVTFQFSIAIALFIATAVIYWQVEYSMQRDPGFNSANMLVLDNLNRRTEVSAVKNTLKSEITALAGVESVALSGHQPMQTRGYVQMELQHTLEGRADNPLFIATMSVDQDFLDTWGLQLVAGRGYDITRDQPTPLFQGGYVSDSGTSESSVVINEGAARALGFAEAEAALGERLVGTRGFNPTLHNFTIIGVVQDSQFFSLRNAPRAELYVLSPQFMTDVIGVRFSGNSQEVVQRIAGVWNRVTGGADLSIAFVEQNLAAEFREERVEARLLVGFALLAIIIACLGLYGSATFSVERRTKEIGVRKVLGAAIGDIVGMLLWQFSKPVLLANVIAWPVAAWAMLRWLQRFPYQIDSVVLVPLCVLAGAVALSVAWLAVAGNAIKVAQARPVLALRYE